MAILAEKYAVDYSWYVDTILNLIRIAGDYVSEEVWYRVLQIVTNRDDVQGYAAKTVFEVSTPTSPPLRPHSGTVRQSKDSWCCGASPPWPPSCSHLLRAVPLGHQGTGGRVLTGQCEGQRAVGVGHPVRSHRSACPSGFPLLLPQERGPGATDFTTCVSRGQSLNWFVPQFPHLLFHPHHSVHEFHKLMGVTG